jgi:putative addiction module CopG family antidote
MAQGVNVRLSGSLKEFLDDQIAPKGLYESASEYVRTLIREDYERIEARRWSRLVSELKPGVSAAPSEFHEVSARDVINRCRERSE